MAYVQFNVTGHGVFDGVHFHPIKHCSVLMYPIILNHEDAFTLMVFICHHLNLQWRTCLLYLIGSGFSKCILGISCIVFNIRGHCTQLANNVGSGRYKREGIRLKDRYMDKWKKQQGWQKEKRIEAGVEARSR